MPGHPDYLRTFQQTSDPLLYNAAMALNSTYVSAAIYAAEWQELSIRIAANGTTAGGQYRVLLSFYADQACTQLVQTFDWDVNSTLSLYDTVSVVAPWLRVTQNGTTVINGQTATVIISPMVGGTANKKTNPVNGLLTVSSLTVGAAGSKTQGANYETSGAATISCSVNGTSRNAEVYVWAYDITGATTIIWGHTFATADTQDYVTADLWLPPQYLEAHCLNHNGANPCFWNMYIGAAA